MDRIIGYRQTGKTESAIKIALTENIPIVVKSMYEKKRLTLMQNGRNFAYNPPPLSLYDIIRKWENGEKVPDVVIIDDGEYVLQALLSKYGIKSIRAITITENEIPEEGLPVNDFTVWDFLNKFTGYQQQIIIYDDDCKQKIFDNYAPYYNKIDEIDNSIKVRKVTKITIDNLTRALEIYV